MRLAVAVAASVIAFLPLGSDVLVATHCGVGEVAGFAELRSDPPELVGTLDGPFTGEARYFERRYNCMGRGAQVRRIGLGVYEIRFPGLANRLAVVSAVSDEGIAASVRPLSDGIFRVSLRGPLAGGDVAARRDVAFSIAVY